MRAPVFLLLTLMPGTAGAAGLTSSGGGGMVAVFIQMLASLAIVIGALLLGGRLARRCLSGGLARKSVPRYIRVVESRFLGPKRSLMLVEVGGEYLLLGSTDEGISLIKQVDMLETVEIVEELAGAAGQARTPALTLGRITDLFQKLGSVNPLVKRAM
jgi:flagellar protein FliO/FliZ